MMKTFLATASLGLAVCTLVQCTDPTIIGSELIEGTGLPLTYNDSLPLSFETILLDPSPAGDVFTVGGASVGCLEDPLFGTTRASLGFELVVVDSRNNVRRLINLPVDSVTLFVPLEPLLQIGDTTAEVSLEVREAAEGTLRLEETLTDEPLETTEKVYGSTTVVPSRDTVEVPVYSSSGERVIARRGPLLRVPLSLEFAEDIASGLRQGLLADTTTNTLNDENFIASFPGLVLQAQDCSETMVGVNLSVSRIQELAVIVYVNLADSAVSQYRLALRRSTVNGVAPIARARPSNSRDYDGSLAAEVQEGGAAADSVGLVQGPDGLALQVNLPDPTVLGDRVAVNYAVLQVPVLRDEFTDPITRIIPQRFNSVGDLITFSGASTNATGTYNAREGGFITKVPTGSGSDSVEIYQFVLTSYMQGVAEGRLDPTIFLVPQNRRFIAGRTVFGIDDSRSFPPRLLLATTTLP